MIQFVLNLLGLGNRLSRLQKKSSDALGTFNETLNDLKEVQGGILKHHKQQQSKIEKALATQKTLMEQHTTNSKVIGKIEEFLS
jgi:5-methylcytosine-specific restriction endonuclease McrBC GTP-binding regulatory subunit McrB